MSWESVLYAVAFGSVMVAALLIYAYVLSFIFPKYRRELTEFRKTTVEFWSLSDAKRFVKEFVKRKG
jgi:hypothetical protein